MRMFCMFEGIGGFTRGIEQAYERLQRQSNMHRHCADAVVCDQDGQSSGRNGAKSSISNNFPTSERQQQRRIVRHTNDADIEQIFVGMEQSDCVGYSEIDKYASAIYKYRYPKHRNYGDATKLVCDELPDFDLLCAGFPCQSFSIAGKRRGFNDTRGTLFFEIARVLSHKRPPHFLLENVKGLLSSDGGKTFAEILRILAELGYFVETIVLNSSDYGVPQNRERVFFIGHLAEKCAGEILSFGNSNSQFDEIQRAAREGEKRNPFFAEETVRSNERFDNRRKWGKRLHSVGTLRTYKDGNGFREMTGGKCRTLPARAREDGSGQPVVVQTQSRIRRLTPPECCRLQGFPDEWCDYGLFENGEIQKISDTQKYKCLGNAVSVPVIETVISEMLKKGCLTPSKR